MSDVFTARPRVQAMLDVEAALAHVESSLGIIPSTAGDSIVRACHADLYDTATLIIDARHDGNLAIPLVRSLTKKVAEQDQEAARYVHWGATSQDILDTALVLQLRDALPNIIADLDRTSRAAAEHATGHIRSVMAGRTWLQQSTPITFGLKAAGWVDALRRVQHQLQDAFERALMLQFGGASGTLAALGARGLDVAEALGAALRLQVPPMPWHAHRDRVASLACALGIVAGTLGKIGRDLALLAASEVNEAHASSEHSGGSSAMPQKHNPVHAATAVAVATRAPGLVSTVLSAMLQEHERGLGTWQAESDAVPDLVNAVAQSAAATAVSLETLIVDPVRMRANLDVTNGQIMSEAITMRLARRIGKSEAHAIVAAACRRSTEERRPLRDVLLEDPSFGRVLNVAEMDEALSPEQYLGASSTFITRALKGGD